MGKIHTEIDRKSANWIEQQRMFFVATAPISREGLVNLSPKGLDSFRILDAHTVAYLDLTGSGIETIAHVKENARITIMFCAFEGSPKILRIYDHGEVIEKSNPRFNSLKSKFPNYKGARAIIIIKIKRVADSCGFGIPVYHFQQQRDTLINWAKSKGGKGIKSYQKEHNKQSLDKLKGLEMN